MLSKGVVHGACHGSEERGETLAGQWMQGLPARGHYIITPLISGHETIHWRFLFPAPPSQALIDFIIAASVVGDNRHYSSFLF